MTTKRYWVISLLECYPQHEGFSEVVFSIHWRRQATDVEGHVADVYGEQRVSLDPIAPFTPFSNLSQKQVEQWLEDAMGADCVADLDAALDQQLADQINPQVVRPALPWAS